MFWRSQPLWKIHPAGIFVTMHQFDDFDDENDEEEVPNESPVLATNALNDGDETMDPPAKALDDLKKVSKAIIQ